jgi:hypothetical protein
VSKPKAPKEDPSTIALRERQAAELARLDEEENLRIKQLLIGQRGGRFFRGSPAMRAAPGDRSAGFTSAGSTGLFGGLLGRAVNAASARATEPASARRYAGRPLLDGGK